MTDFRCGTMDVGDGFAATRADPVMSKSNVTSRTSDRIAPRIFLCLVITIFGLLGNVAASASSGAVKSSVSSFPVNTTGTKLYIGHRARLTARIPATWQVDPIGDEDYAGSDGFIGSEPVSSDGNELDEACAREAHQPRFGPDSRTRPDVWHGQPACRIDAADHQIAAIVLHHARPLKGYAGTVNFVALFADPNHLRGIATTVSFSPDSVTPEAYLTSVLDLIEARSFWRDYVDWPRVREEALSIAAGASTLAETDSAILQVIYELRDVGDRHSFFLTTSAVEIWLQGGLKGYIAPTGHRLENSIGYVKLPGLEGDEDAGLKYGTTAQSIVAVIDEKPTCGWVVDLREDTGGNMYAMLAGVGALIGDGQILRWIYPDGRESVVSYRGGHIYSDAQDYGTLLGHSSYEPHEEAPPVAVLIGQQTASAGEATTLAFVGRPNTRSFGQMTFGLTTFNSSYLLFDGALLALSAGWMADRSGAIYPNGIQPDQEVEATTSESSAEDPTLEAAVAWLRQQPVCADMRSNATPAGAAHD